MDGKEHKAYNRRQAAYDGSAHGKATHKAWGQSEAGRVSQRLRNQRRRDKQRDALNQARAADQQRIRDAEIYLDGVLIGHIIDGVSIPLPIKE